MTASGPLAYMAKPQAMGALISNVFMDRLYEHGLTCIRVNLMAVYVDEQAAAPLAQLKRRPTPEAIGVALGVVAKAWDEAMTLHGLFRQTDPRRGGPPTRLR